MAQIPQIDLGPLPASGVPRGELPSPESISAPLAMGGEVLETIGKEVSKEERIQAYIHRQALEKKQAIVNEVTSARYAGDFEEMLRANSQGIQQEFWDSPDKALTAFYTRSRALVGEAVDAAKKDNSEIGLAVAQKADASVNREMTAMHSWAQSRMTQKAKNDLSVTVNQTTKAAEDLPTVEALSSFLDAKQKELSPLFSNIHGEVAGEKLREMRSTAAKAWVLKHAEQDPLATAAALDAPKGPLVDNLDGADRKSLRSDVQQIGENFGKVRNWQILKESAARNTELMDTYRSGELKASDIGSVLRANAEQQNAARIDPKYTPEQKAEHLDSLKTQEKFLSALKTAKQKELPFDATDNPEMVESLYQRQEGLFKKNKGAAGKDLSDALKFQADLTSAYADKNISAGTFTTMFKGLSLDLTAALKKEEGNTGEWYKFGMFKSARQAGNVEMNDLTEFQNLKPDQRIQARVFYMTQFNAAIESGRVVDEKATRAMARKAVSNAGSVYIPEGKP